MGQMLSYAADLNQIVMDLRRARDEIESAYLDTLHRLALAAEYKDDDTGKHILRIGQYSRALAERAGLADSDCQLIGHAAPMHDIGKLGVPDAILGKPGRLTPEEFAVIRLHPLIGSRILSGSRSDALKMAERIARSHHEDFNGGGYPVGLRGGDIPIEGRIVRIVDVYDALLSRRPYKEPWPLDRVLDVMRQGMGVQFDPDLLDLFLDDSELCRNMALDSAECYNDESVSEAVCARLYGIRQSN